MKIGRRASLIVVVALVAVTALALPAGCASPRLIRTDPAPVERCNPDEKDGSLAPGDHARCALTSVERAADTGGKPYEYTLNFVEFDDQGWEFVDGERRSLQMDALFKRLREQLKAAPTRSPCVVSSHRLNVVVYVHGWKHGAAADDSNVANFRRLLREVATAECTGLPNVGQKRSVVGIYVGWLGAPIQADNPLVNLTFWNRKDAASSVAQGGVRELIARLDAIADQQNASNRDPDTKAVRMLFIGHSFGGHILLTGLGGSIVRDLASYDESIRQNPPTECLAAADRAISRSGDMVVLVNPALEATRFEAIHNIARGWQHTCYRAPLFVSVTSQGDVATRRFFPLARSLLPLWEHYTSGAQKRADQRTFGHDERFLTHRLMTTEEFGKSEYAGKVASLPPAPPCGAWTPNNMVAAVQAEWTNHLNFVASLEGGWKPADARSFCASTILVPVGLTGTGYAPVLNILASEALIKDHSSIYDPRFVSFIRELYMDTVDTAAVRAAQQPAKK